jgi:hypothetical protein
MKSKRSKQLDAFPYNSIRQFIRENLQQNRKTLTVSEKVNVIITPQDFSQIKLLLIKFHNDRLAVLQYLDLDSSPTFRDSDWDLDSKVGNSATSLENDDHCKVFFIYCRLCEP